MRRVWIGLVAACALMMVVNAVVILKVLFFPPAQDNPADVEARHRITDLENQNAGLRNAVTFLQMQVEVHERQVARQQEQPGWLVTQVGGQQWMIQPIKKEK